MFFGLGEWMGGEWWGRRGSESQKFYCANFIASENPRKCINLYSDFSLNMWEDHNQRQNRQVSQHISQSVQFMHHLWLYFTDHNLYIQLLKFVIPTAPEPKTMHQRCRWHRGYFIHFQPVLSTFNHFQPLSSTLIHFHPLSSTFIHFHPLSSTFIHFHPLSFSFIPFHPLSPIFIHFQPLSSTFIHVHLILSRGSALVCFRSP